MKKKIKRIFKWTGIVLAVIILILALIPFIFKKQIVQAVKDEVNKSLNATVDFKDYGLNLFSSFPNFTLSLEDLSVVGVEAFKEDTLADIEELSVSLNLFSVFSGDYEIRKIEIDDPKIHLKVLPGGKANWDIVKPSADTTAADTSQPSAFKLKLKKLEINDANIVFEDFDERMFITVADLDHTLSGDLSADMTTLYTKTHISELSFETGGISYLNKARIAIKADLEADLKNSKYTFNENEFAINELFLGFDGWLALPDDGYDMDLKFSAKKTEFKNFLSLIPAIFMKDFEDIKTSGSLGFDGFAKGKYSDEGLPAFALNLTVDNGMFQYPDLPGAVTAIFINAKVSNKGGSEDNTIIDVSKLHLEMGGNPVDASIYVSAPVSDPQIDAKVKGKIDLAKVKDFYPLEDQKLSGLFTADVSIKGKMSYVDNEQYEKFDAKGTLIVENFDYNSKEMSGGVSVSKAELAFSPQYLDLRALTAKTGRSDISAKGKTDNYLAYLFRDELLKGNFELTSSLIDLNEFMSEDEADAEEPEAEGEADESMSVIELPGNIDFVLNTRIGKVLYDDMEITDISGGITLRDRTAVMKELKMQLLQGSLVLGGSYSTANALVPKIDLNLDLRNIDIQTALKHLPSLGKFAPIAEKANGKFSAGMSYASDLKSDMSPDYATVNGAGRLQTHQVSISNAGFFNKLSDELKINLFRSFNVNDVNISFKIVNGAVLSQPFDIKLGKSNLNVEGVTKLDETINYVMKLSVPRSEFGGAANNVLNNLVSQASSKGLDIKPGETVNIDILAGGTVTKPTFKLGLKGSMGNLADDLKNQAQQVIEEKKEEIISDVKDKANAAIAEAERKAQQLISDAELAAQKIRAEAQNAGDKLIAEADAQGQKLISEAKNPIAKEAAKVTAKKLKEEAQKKANDLNAKADKQANDVISKARDEADKLRNDAKNKVN